MEEEEDVFGIEGSLGQVRLGGHRRKDKTSVRVGGLVR